MQRRQRNPREKRGEPMYRVAIGRGHQPHEQIEAHRQSDLEAVIKR